METTKNPMASVEVEDTKSPPPNTLLQLETELIAPNNTRNKILGVLGGMAVIAGVAFAGGYLSGSESSSGSTVSDNGVTSTTISVNSLTAEEAVGEIVCVNEAVTQAFQWTSSASSLTFEAINAKGLSVNELSGFNGVSGVELSGNGEEVEVSVGSLLEGVVSGEADETELRNLADGVVGECLAQLAVGLGELGYIGRDSPALLPIMQFGLVMMRAQKEAVAAGRNLESTVWNLDALNERLFPEKKERKLQGCNTNQWYRLGDGRCDTEFNNAECNFDNGDCCSKTCKNFGSLWGGLSPEDDDDIRHPVYNCDVDDSETCVTECTASNQGRLGDGRCDSDLNNEACQFDLGDCCEDTCNEDAQFDCESNGYNCISGANGWADRLYCDNPSFGMCGGGDSCIKSLCGDCYAHFECADHDQYCSCDGTLTLGCINVFRSWCD